MSNDLIPTLQALGFDEINTGGGCTAMAYTFDAYGTQLLVTDDAAVPDGPEYTLSVWPDENSELTPTTGIGVSQLLVDLHIAVNLLRDEWMDKCEVPLNGAITQPQIERRLNELMRRAASDDDMQEFAAISDEVENFERLTDLQAGVIDQSAKLILEGKERT